MFCTTVVPVMKWHLGGASPSTFLHDSEGRAALPREPFFQIIDEGEERTWQRPDCLVKQIPQIPTKLLAADSSHVYEWNCRVSRRSHKYSVWVVTASCPPGARPQHQQWLLVTWWCLGMMGRGSKPQVASILNHLHPDQTTESLCAQDTTLSCKWSLSTSAGPQRQGQLPQWSQDMIRWGSRPVLNIHTEQSAIFFGIQDTKSSDTCIQRRLYCATRRVLHACMWYHWTCCAKEWIVTRCTLVTEELWHA